MRGSLTPMLDVVLHTDRLALRPLRMDDAPAVQALAADLAIAMNTLSIPHPYPAGAAEEFITRMRAHMDDGKGVVFAIMRSEDDVLVGTVGLTINRDHRRAELGYWIGVPFWKNGYATEAAARVLRWGFDSLQIQRIFAHHMLRNPASGKVLRKIGMTFEGVLPRHVFKWDEFVDLALYGAVRGLEGQSGGVAGPSTAALQSELTFGPLHLPRIETERLVLRPMDEDDVPRLAEICNDPELAKATDGIDIPYTEARARKFIMSSLKEAAEGKAAVFGIERRDTGRLIGDIGIWHLDPYHRRGNLGCVIARTEWNRGHATEALWGLLGYAFDVLELHRVDGGCLSWHTASARVLEKCGLKPEGVRREREWRGDHFQDETVFGLLRREFEALREEREGPSDAGQGKTAV